MVTRSLCLLVLLALSVAAQTPRIPPSESINRNGLVSAWLLRGLQVGNANFPSSCLSWLGTTSGIPIRSPEYLSVGGRDAVAIRGTNRVSFGASNIYSPVSNDFSVVVWVRRLAAPGSYVYVSKIDLAFNNSPYGWAIVGGNFSGDYISAKWGNGSLNQIFLRTTPLNKWQHIALTRSGAAFSMYVDGTVAGTNGYSGAIGGQGKTLYIGRDSDSDTANTQAMVNDLRFYKRALTAAEIKRIYRGLE
jgi:hypothetical protein